MGFVKSVVGKRVNSLLERMNYRIVSIKPSGPKIELNPADGGDDYNW